MNSFGSAARAGDGHAANTAPAATGARARRDATTPRRHPRPRGVDGFFIVSREWSSGMTFRPARYHRPAQKYLQAGIPGTWTPDVVTRPARARGAAARVG